MNSSVSLSPAGELLSVLFAPFKPLWGSGLLPQEHCRSLFTPSILIPCSFSWDGKVSGASSSQDNRLHCYFACLLLSVNKVNIQPWVLKLTRTIAATSSSAAASRFAEYNRVLFQSNMIWGLRLSELGRSFLCFVGLCWAFEFVCLENILFLEQQVRNPWMITDISQASPDYIKAHFPKKGQKILRYLAFHPQKCYCSDRAAPLNWWCCCLWAGGQELVLHHGWGRDRGWHCSAAAGEAAPLIKVMFLDELLNIDPFSSSLLTRQAEVKLMTLLPLGNPNALANISSCSRSWLWCTRQSCTILGVCRLPKLPLQPLHYRCSVLGFFGLECSRGSLSIRKKLNSVMLHPAKDNINSTAHWLLQYFWLFILLGKNSLESLSQTAIDISGNSVCCGH